MRVLSWNLYHGRDFPPDKALFTLRSRVLRVTERNETHVQVNRSLLDEFAGWLAGREWDVALLQEAPPRWFGELERRTGSSGARVLTSRNVLPPLQRLLAEANPDLIASWEGGSNQLLVRAPGRVVEQREPDAHTATRAPADAVGAHSAAGRGDVVLREPARVRGPAPEGDRTRCLAAAAAAVEWSEADPLVFGGDLNLRPARHPARVRRAARAPSASASRQGPTRSTTCSLGASRSWSGRGGCPQRSASCSEPDGRRLRPSDHAPVVAHWEVGSPRAGR